MKSFTSGNGDFLHGFQTVADEGGTDDVQPIGTVFRQADEKVLRARFQPASAPEAALEGDGVFLLAQAECGGEQAGGFTAFVGIGVTRVVMRLRDAVKTHHQVPSPAVLLPIGGNLLAQGLDVGGMVIEAADGTQPDLVALAQHGAEHLIQCRTAAGGSVLRIKRDGQNPGNALRFEFGHGVGHAGQAVCHGRTHQHAGQALRQGIGLAAAVNVERRAFLQPDFFIVCRAAFGAERQNCAAQYGLPQGGFEFDDALVGQEIAQEGADGFRSGRGRCAEVDEEDGGLRLPVVRQGGFGLETGHVFPFRRPVMRQADIGFRVGLPTMRRKRQKRRLPVRPMRQTHRLPAHRPAQCSLCRLLR